MTSRLRFAAKRVVFFIERESKAAEGPPAGVILRRERAAYNAGGQSEGVSRCST